MVSLAGARQISDDAVVYSPAEPRCSLMTAAGDLVLLPLDGAELCLHRRHLACCPEAFYLPSRQGERLGNDPCPCPCPCPFPCPVRERVDSRRIVRRQRRRITITTLGQRQWQRPDQQSECCFGSALSLQCRSFCLVVACSLIFCVREKGHDRMYRNRLPVRLLRGGPCG